MDEIFRFDVAGDVRGARAASGRRFQLTLNMWKSKELVG
jgi:hypothetical protein